MKMPFFSRKAQGLPIYVIGVIILGIVVLALVLIFLFGVSNRGRDQVGNLFDTEEHFASNVSETLTQYVGSADASIKLSNVESNLNYCISIISSA